MTSEGLGEMFEGDSADTCAGKFPLVSMGGRADRQACADGERGPHRRERKFVRYFSFLGVVTAAIQNHRRGCRRVSNFCMGP